MLAPDVFVSVTYGKCLLETLANSTSALTEGIQTTVKHSKLQVVPECVVLVWIVPRVKLKSPQTTCYWVMESVPFKVNRRVLRAETNVVKAQDFFFLPLLTMKYSAYVFSYHCSCSLGNINVNGRSIGKYDCILNKKVEVVTLIIKVDSNRKCRCISGWW